MNPQGYKVYWSDGCQIRPPLDKGISECITQNLEPWIDYKAEKQKRKNDTMNNNDTTSCFGFSNPEITKLMSTSYYESIQSSGLIAGEAKIPFPSNIKVPKIAYSAMHGVGYPWAVKLFETFQLHPFYIALLKLCQKNTNKVYTFVILFSCKNSSRNLINTYFRYRLKVHLQVDLLH